MKKLLLFCLIGLFQYLVARDETPRKPCRVIFYNVDNLFDTYNDPKTKDDDYLPTSKNEWTEQKYQAKLEHVSKVLAAMLDTVQPIVIGLAEVENKKILEELINQPALKKFNFGIVHHDSPDEKGLDVAILFNKDLIQEVFDTYIAVDYTFDKADKARDIIVFKGFITSEFPVYFFVNHWKNRSSAVPDEMGSKKRITNAMALKDMVESIYKTEPFARIVVMGDFNDNPDDKSLNYLISGKHKYPLSQDLVNLMRLPQSKNEFTMVNKGKPEVFDQFVVSRNLLTSENPYYIGNSAAHIFKPDWLMHNYPNYGSVPNPTFFDGQWVNGYSDHLPVYIDLNFH